MLLRLTHIGQIERSLIQMPLLSVMNRDVLPRDGVLVLEPAVAESLTRQVPTLANGGDRFGCADRSLVELIDRKRSVAQNEVAEFFNDEVCGESFELQCN